MAVSGSTNFSMTAADLVEAARRKIGIHADEEPLQAHELVAALRTLNMMLKAWQVDGMKTWTLTEGQITLVQGDADYAFGAGGAFTTVPLEIVSARIQRNAGNDIPMWRLSREGYFELPNKSIQGYPTQFYYDRQREGGMLYVWPAPDVSAGTLKFTYRRVMMDIDAQSNNLDLPQEWYEAILYNLADRFAEDNGGVDPAVAQKVAMKAAQTYETVKGFDVGEGEGSISIAPYEDYR